MVLVDKVNQFIDINVFWVIIKDEIKQQFIYDVCLLGINLFCILVIYLKLVLFVFVEKVEVFLNDELIWESSQFVLIGYVINKFKLMMQCVEMDKIEVMVEVLKESLVVKLKIDLNSLLVKDLISEIIFFDDFVKVDLCIVCIVNVEYVEKVDKLL